MTSASARDTMLIADHPDILALRERYEQAAEGGSAQFVQGALIMAGLWAAISAWVVDFFTISRSLGVSDLIIGLAVALLAFSYSTAYSRSHRVAWITPLLGIWLIITPWVIQNTQHSAGVIASNVAAGACVCVLGLAAAAMGKAPRYRLTLTRGPVPARADR